MLQIQFEQFFKAIQRIDCNLTYWHDVIYEAFMGAIQVRCQGELILVSECCSVEFDFDEGRCRQCHEGCVGVEVCDKCSKGWGNCLLGTIEFPYEFPGTDKYEEGWNDCLKEIMTINSARRKKELHNEVP